MRAKLPFTGIPPSKKPPFKDCRVGSLEDDADYLSAVDGERFNRMVPFLDITETVGHFECVQMTLQQLVNLQLNENTCFLPPEYGNPTYEHLFGFLWRLSPHYSVGRSLRAAFYRWHHYQKCKALFLPNPPPGVASFNRGWVSATAKKNQRFQQQVDAVRNFIDETFQDMRRGAPSAGLDVQYYSDAAWIVGVMGREFNWSMRATLNAPVKVIYQLLRVHLHHKLGNKAGLSNKSSEILHAKN